MPRAALLSIHARVEGTAPGTWEDPSLVQVWGPRFHAYVVAERDRAVFTVGRLPDSPSKRRDAEQLADRLEAFLDGRQMKFGEAGRGLGLKPNALRYAAPTGRVVMRWDGARQPTIWMVPPPALDPGDARLELARRYLHVLGPATAEAFAEWAAIAPARGRAAFDALGDSVTPVRTPVGDAWMLSADEDAFRASVGADVAPARLLPSGDPYFLLKGADRELLVPDPERRRELWTPRVWPGAVLVRGEVAGAWRRAGAVVTIQAWRPLSATARVAVELEAQSFPLPDFQGGIRVAWAAA
jgi:winged helix DNA-binding protein